MADEKREIFERLYLPARSSDDIAVGEILDLAEEAFGSADVAHAAKEVEHLFETFGIRPDAACTDYRHLSLQ